MFGFYLDRFAFSVSMATGIIGIVFGVAQVYIPWMTIDNSAEENIIGWVLTLYGIVDTYSSLEREIQIVFSCNLFKK